MQIEMEKLEEDLRKYQQQLKVQQILEEKYQYRLKEVKNKLEFREYQLIQFNNSSKQLDQAIKKYNEDFQSQTKQLRQSYDSKIDKLNAQYNSILEQQRELQYQHEQPQNRRNEEFEFQTQQLRGASNQIINLSNSKNNSIVEQQNEVKYQQEKINLNKMMDFEPNLKYEKNLSQINPKYQIYNNYFKQESYSDIFQQSKKFLQEIAGLLKKLQGKNTKSQKKKGAQVISKIQTNYLNSYALNSLLDENFFGQVNKLIRIVNQISTDQKIRTSSKQYDDITNLEKLHIQLQENMRIIMKQYKDKIKYNCWFCKKQVLLFLIIILLIIQIIYQKVAI